MYAFSYATPFLSGGKRQHGITNGRSLRCQPPHHVSAPSKRKRGQIVATSSRGFGGFLSNSNSTPANIRDVLPEPSSPCPCGSEKSYGRCCRRFHSGQSSPQGAEELLRSRYSAYAHRLPSYIMRTTHPSVAELDRRNWKKEILDFCMEYLFVGGVDIIEQQITGPYTTRILFRYA